MGSLPGCACRPSSRTLCTVCQAVVRRVGGVGAVGGAGVGAPAQARAQVGRQVATLTLPYPPSGNHLYRQNGPQRHLRAEVLRYRQAVALACQAQWLAMQPRPAWPLTDRLTITAYLYRSDRRATDLDNGIKVIGDALQEAGVYANDSQIDEWHVYRGQVSQPARVEVTIGVKGEASL